MCNSNDKDKKPETKRTSSDQIVTPIYNGHPQPSRTLEQAVEDLGNDQPNTWSIIK